MGQFLLWVACFLSYHAFSFRASPARLKKTAVCLQIIVDFPLKNGYNSTNDDLEVFLREIL